MRTRRSFAPAVKQPGLHSKLPFRYQSEPAYSTRRVAKVQTSDRENRFVVAAEVSGLRDPACSGQPVACSRRSAPLVVAAALLLDKFFRPIRGSKSGDAGWPLRQSRIPKSSLQLYQTLPAPVRVCCLPGSACPCENDLP